MELWEKLGALRKQADMTLAEVANALPGKVSRVAVGFWESENPDNRTEPRKANREALAALYGLSVEQLMSQSDNVSKSKVEKQSTDRNEDRARFSKRLIEVLDSLGYPVKRRPSILSKEFDVSDKDASKWLAGEAIPSHETILQMLAKWELGPEALEYGRGMLHEQEGDFNVLACAGKVPILAKLSAGPPDELIDPYEPGAADEWLHCPSPHSRSTFGTYVNGNSMTSESGQSFPHGSVIFADPTLVSEAAIGDMVVARIASTGQQTFKMLDSEDGVPILVPLNNSSAYKPIREEFEVLAIVIGNFIPTRRGV